MQLQRGEGGHGPLAARASPALRPGAALHQSQARRDGRVLGLPIVRNSDSLTVLETNHPEDGDAGHPAHRVKGGALAVDQPFLGHVFQQGLQRDLLVPLQAEGAGDLALADGLIAAGDEVEDLLAAGQAVIAGGCCVVVGHHAALEGIAPQRQLTRGFQRSFSNQMVRRMVSSR